MDTAMVMAVDTMADHNGDWVKEYRVYEITPEFREHGKLLKRYKSKDRAYAFMNKSIYRYVKEREVLVVTIHLW